MKQRLTYNEPELAVLAEETVLAEEAVQSIDKLMDSYRQGNDINVDNLLYNIDDTLADYSKKVKEFWK